MSAEQKKQSQSGSLSPRPRKAQGWVAVDPSVVPAASRMALRKAMGLEKTPAGDYSDLLWIMAQQSAGVVNAHNPDSMARGLFQLMRAQYPMNPNGEKSFGVAVEEAQGGIRYLYGRYHSAFHARKFLEQHHWV